MSMKIRLSELRKTIRNVLSEMGDLAPNTIRDYAPDTVVDPGKHHGPRTQRSAGIESIWDDWESQNTHRDEEVPSTEYGEADLEQAGPETEIEPSPRTMRSR